MVRVVHAGPGRFPGAAERRTSPPEERARITGWEATSADFRADSDQIYGVPAGSDGTTCFFYNKELLAKAGVDPEGELARQLR